MKATTIILAAVLTLQVNFLFAANDGAPMNSPSIVSNLDITELIPTTPAVATFEDYYPATINVSALAPVVPVEADFEDVTLAGGFDISKLAPIVPAEADFSDSPDVETDITALAFVAPATADFE